MATEKWMRERVTGNEVTKMAARVLRLWHFTLSKTGSPWKTLTRLTPLRSSSWLCEGDSGEARRGGARLRPPFKEGLGVLL